MQPRNLPPTRTAPSSKLMLAALLAIALAAAGCPPGLKPAAHVPPDAGTVHADAGCEPNCEEPLPMEDGGIDAGTPDAGPEAICGDGVIDTELGETCDDGNQKDADGCSANCSIEDGYACEGMPSVCSSICGDGLIVAQEACDDGNTTPADGCDGTCAVEPGYVCSGIPSQCETDCGDGIRAGDEACDDGEDNGKGACTTSCMVATGEDCTQPLVASQGQQAQNALNWSLGDGAAVRADWIFTCDSVVGGQDLVFRYDKVTGDLASGGNLLRIRVDQTGAPPLAELVLEVTGSACHGSRKKCVRFLDATEQFLDLPAGSHFIWVGLIAPGTFPAIEVTVEEVPASQALGEACWGPHDAASPTYTPPSGTSAAHVWSLPAGTMRSLDMSAQWAGEGWLSCEEDTQKGGLHAADAVVEVEKLSFHSGLRVEVEAQGSSTARVGVELLSACAPAGSNSQRAGCVSGIQQAELSLDVLPAGKAWLWVTGSEPEHSFGGATVRVTEEPWVMGEAPPVPEPIFGSASITPSSVRRVQPPSCFPEGSRVHWYAYTVMNGAVSVRTVGQGARALTNEFGSAHMCAEASAQYPIGWTAAPGTQVLIAVEVGSGITGLIIEDLAYTGIEGVLTDLNVALPSFTPTGIALQGSDVVVSSTSSLYSFDAGGNTTATPVLGPSAPHLGFGLVSDGSSVFSLEPNTAGGRVYRLSDGATWTPTPWGLLAAGDSYPGATVALTREGTDLFFATREPGRTSFYQLSALAPGPPTLLGTNHHLELVSAIAVDDAWFYVGNIGLSHGIYRVPRNDPSAIPTLMLRPGIDLSGTLVTDNPTAANFLYAHSGSGPIHVIVRPSGDFIPLGELIPDWDADVVMTIDRSIPRLYLVERRTTHSGGGGGGGGEGGGGGGGGSSTTTMHAWRVD